MPINRTVPAFKKFQLVTLCSARVLHQHIELVIVRKYNFSRATSGGLIKVEDISKLNHSNLSISSRRPERRYFKMILLSQGPSDSQYFRDRQIIRASLTYIS